MNSEMWPYRNEHSKWVINMHTENTIYNRISLTTVPIIWLAYFMRHNLCHIDCMVEHLQWVPVILRTTAIHTWNILNHERFAHTQKYMKKYSQHKLASFMAVPGEMAIQLGCHINIIMFTCQDFRFSRCGWATCNSLLWKHAWKFMYAHKVILNNNECSSVVVWELFAAVECMACVCVCDFVYQRRSGSGWWNQIYGNAANGCRDNHAMWHISCKSPYVYAI